MRLPPSLRPAGPLLACVLVAAAGCEDPAPLLIEISAPASVMAGETFAVTVTSLGQAV